MIELVEMEIRELLGEYGYEAEETPVVVGSAKCALDGVQDNIGKESILKLMEAVDDYIPTPDRDSDKPFLMCIEGVHLREGRAIVGGDEKGLARIQLIEYLGGRDNGLLSVRKGESILHIVFPFPRISVPCFPISFCKTVESSEEAQTLSILTLTGLSFLLVFPQTYSIQGRGTVASGRLEQGLMKKDDKIEILGHNQVMKSAINGSG